MPTIKRTDEFAAWLDGLKDRMTRVRLARRLDKAQHGNLGMISRWVRVYLRCVSFSGQAWRMYYVQRGEVLIVMLGGGEKSSQSSDIAKATALAAKLEE